MSIRNRLLYPMRIATDHEDRPLIPLFSLYYMHVYIYTHAGGGNTGRSRNDQVATDVRLYLRDEAARIQVRALHSLHCDG